MRQQAQANGLTVPAFTGVFNYDRLRHFMETVPPPGCSNPAPRPAPWALKKFTRPKRSGAGWTSWAMSNLTFLLEQFITGDMYHVDAIVHDGKWCWPCPTNIGSPP
jgi:hypothetical protein